ncbi:MAG: hypothetical protein ACTS73_01580 [Arsenophonus sp. NEOnobi-MAG3]
MVTHEYQQDVSLSRFSLIGVIIVISYDVGILFPGCWKVMPDTQAAFIQHKTVRRIGSQP